MKMFEGRAPGTRWGTEVKQYGQVHSHYIKNSINPHDFYAHTLPTAKIKRHGWNDGGLCPFHADKHAGSFRINTDTGSFKCFSCGAGGGDIIAFTMLLYDINFIEAIDWLAEQWCVS